MRIHQAYAILQAAAALQAMDDLGCGASMYPILHDDPEESPVATVDYMSGFVEYSDSDNLNSRTYNIWLVPGPDDQYIQVRVDSDRPLQVVLLKETFMVADPAPADSLDVSRFPQRIGEHIAEHIAQVIRAHELAHHPHI